MSATSIHTFWPLSSLRGCVHLIIDAEVPIVADTGCGGGGGNGNGSDDGKGGTAGICGPSASAFGHSASPCADSASELLREAVEALLFPGAVPVPPWNPAGSTSVPPPPAILNISPAAVYVPLHVPGKCSNSDGGGGSSVVSVALTLRLSRPLLPEEGVILLARHRQCFLDVCVEPALVYEEQRGDDGITIMVRQLPTRLNSPSAPNFRSSAVMLLQHAVTIYCLSAVIHTTCCNIY